MKSYKVKVRVVLEGTVSVSAVSEKQARRYAEEEIDEWVERGDRLVMEAEPVEILNVKEDR